MNTRLTKSMRVMENSDQQQPPILLKHYCKVCKRGFGCAGALGGHMRSHGVGGDSQIYHPSSNEDKSIRDLNCSRPKGTTHSYFLRKASNRFTSYRSSEDRDKIRPSSGGERVGKCTTSSESEEDQMNKRSSKSEKYDHEDNNYYYGSSEEEEDLANCLVMLSNKSFILSKEENKAKEVEIKGNMFQCKACKKVFNSHQALGGHRASHKKVKGCYASKFVTNSSLNEDNNFQEDHNLNNHDEINFMQSDSSEPVAATGGGLEFEFPPSTTNSSSKGKSKEHECSICHRIFSSGQALGGHKRCHWLTSNLPDNSIIQNLQEQFKFDHSPPLIFKKPMIKKPSEINLDLNNSPVPFDYEAPARIFLQLWGGGGGGGDQDQVIGSNINHNDHHHKKIKQINHNDDLLDDLKKKNDEENRLKKIAKVRDLKEMKLDDEKGGSSGWLQL